MLTGIGKYAGETVRSRASSPKLQVLDTALISALAGYTFAAAQADRDYWGRLVESAVGAHLANAAATGHCELFYWRERNQEVDFVVRRARRLTAIEVKSGRAAQSLPGMQAFSAAFKPDRMLLVGGNGITIEEFLSTPVSQWIA
jgi:predicted AAA+ superfamily ATPase